MSMARTPVCPVSRLMASTTAVREAAALVVVVIDPVVTPLIVTVPVSAAAVIAVPVMVVAPTTARTPVSAVARLIAAALASALDSLAAVERLSSVLRELPITTPLIRKSLACNA